MIEMRPKLHKHFDSALERDAWINKRFPNRTCRHEPGMYDTPNGIVITVRCGTVRVYEPRKEN